MKLSFRLKKLDNSFVTGVNGQPRLRTFKRKDESSATRLTPVTKNPAHTSGSSVNLPVTKTSTTWPLETKSFQASPIFNATSMPSTVPAISTSAVQGAHILQAASPSPKNLSDSVASCAHGSRHYPAYGATLDAFVLPYDHAWSLSRSDRFLRFFLGRSSRSDRCLPSGSLSASGFAFGPSWFWRPSSWIMLRGNTGEVLVLVSLWLTLGKLLDPALPRASRQSPAPFKLCEMFLRARTCLGAPTATSSAAFLKAGWCQVEISSRPSCSHPSTTCRSQLAWFAYTARKACVLNPHLSP